MKRKKDFMAVNLLGGIVLSYLITIAISLVGGDGNYYPCVPSLTERFGNEVTAVIIQTTLSAILGAGFAGCSLICEWMEHSVKGILSYFGVFFAIFNVVWIVQYLIWKVRISKIKEGIQKNN